VITRQLQAAKCSLCSQLFRYIFTLLENFPTVVLNVNNVLLGLCALHWVLVITKQLSDHSSNSLRLRTLIGDCWLLLECLSRI
jgi:hypothetical protein